MKRQLENLVNLTIIMNHIFVFGLQTWPWQCYIEKRPSSESAAEARAIIVKACTCSVRKYITCSFHRTALNTKMPFANLQIMSWLPPDWFHRPPGFCGALNWSSLIHLFYFTLVSQHASAHLKVENIIKDIFSQFV